MDISTYHSLQTFHPMILAPKLSKYYCSHNYYSLNKPSPDSAHTHAHISCPPCHPLPRPHLQPAEPPTPTPTPTARLAYPLPRPHLQPAAHSHAHCLTEGRLRCTAGGHPMHHYMLSTELGQKGNVGQHYPRAQPCRM